MGDKRFTFFELHFHDGPYFEATANAPGSGVLSGGGSDDADAERASAAESGGDADAESEREGSCPGKSAVKALTVVALVAALALLARRLLADDEDDDEDDEGVVYE